MAAPIGLRDDFDAAALRALAKVSRDPGQLRRLLSLAEIYDGGSRGDAARVPLSSSIKPVGMAPSGYKCRTTSHSCPCRPDPPS